MTEKKLIPVILDCDPGNDDIFAILWAMIAHQHGYIDLQGVTTLGGNVSADLTYRNALRMRDFTGIDVPVGKDLRPVVGAGDASHIHGADGIGGLSNLLPDVQEPSQTLDSVQMLIDAIQRQPGQLTILVTGPMTNLAAAERKVPGILQQTKYIIAMGGSFHAGGNVTPTSEFNIWYDSASAKAVFDATDHIVLIPLDVTQSFVFSPEDTEQFLAEINHGYKADFMRKLTQAVIHTTRNFRETHYQNGFFVHDGHVVGFLLYPHLYRGTLVGVHVENQWEYTKGMTVADRRNHARTDYRKTLVITDVDHYGFLEALVQDFREFDFGE